MFNWITRFIESSPAIHRWALMIWKMFPPRVAGFLKGLLTRNWMVGAVAVMIDESCEPAEVLLVRHSYRRTGIWGLPGGALEHIPTDPAEQSGSAEQDNIIELALRREVYEELGIEIAAVNLLRIDAVPYVPEEPGPYRLDFYFRCQPEGGFEALRNRLAALADEDHSPEVSRILFVPVTDLKNYDLYSSDISFFRGELPNLVPGSYDL